MRALSVFLALLSIPAAAVARQFDDHEPTRWTVSGGVIIAQPVGEFADNIGAGFGAAGQALYRLDRQGIVSLRADIGFVNYGNERRRVCFSETVGCRVLLDLTTTNNIFVAGFGPQLEAPLGPIRPFINGGVGLAYFSTRSSVSGTNRDDDFASTTNHDDLTLAWQAGTGFNVPITRGRTPLQLHFGVRYHGNGRAEYLREGDIEDHEDGSITINPRRSGTNFITYQIGVSAVIGRSR
jgi:hypothetical protein